MSDLQQTIEDVQLRINSSETAAVWSFRRRRTEKTPAEIDRMADHLVDVCGGTCTLDIVLLQCENGKRYKKRIVERMNK
jgi:hypothetical protein